MTIKVTVQNGAHHGLSRAEASAIVNCFPAAWVKIVTDVVLYQSKDARLHCEFFKNHASWASSGRANSTLSPTTPKRLTKCWSRSQRFLNTGHGRLAWATRNALTIC